MVAWRDGSALGALLVTAGFDTPRYSSNYGVLVGRVVLVVGTIQDIHLPTQRNEKELEKIAADPRFQAGLIEIISDESSKISI